jgi:spore coat polysaccharide biosynthesis protein SpsF
MGSSRLPGKVLMDVGSQSVLARTVGRLSRAKMVGMIGVATTTCASDDVIANYAEQMGVACFRGPEHDVLARYRGAAEAFRADMVVRITSDCPLIDPEIVDEVVGVCMREDADFACNTMPRTFPRGLDTEVFTKAALLRAEAISNEPHQREHVTPIFYERRDLFRFRSIEAEENHSRYRWTVDTQEDLELIRAIYSNFENGDDFTWRQVVALMQRMPHLNAINSHVMQKPVREAAAAI